MTNEAPDNEVLIWNEAEFIPEHYKPYFKSKRVAFVANANEQSDHWKLYIAIDQTWVRGLSGCEEGVDLDRGIPMILYMSAHNKMRVAMDLAFTGCLAEARSILRDGIEFAAHGHRLHAKPDLQELWLNKKNRLKEWEQQFWYEKPTHLFEGLDHLLERWKAYSNRGSHANLTALIGKIDVQHTENLLTYRLNYDGGEQGRELIMALHELVLTCFLMENTFFQDMKTRLQFDQTLIDMRQASAMERGRLNWDVLAKYDPDTRIV